MHILFAMLGKIHTSHFVISCSKFKPCGEIYALPRSKPIILKARPTYVPKRQWLYPFYSY